MLLKFSQLFHVHIIVPSAYTVIVKCVQIQLFMTNYVIQIKNRNNYQAIVYLLEVIVHDTTSQFLH